jgi:hypothetical protein
MSLSSSSQAPGRCSTFEVPGASPPPGGGRTKDHLGRVVEDSELDRGKYSLRPKKIFGLGKSRARMSGDTRSTGTALQQQGCAMRK